jgi:uncharacterized membrane protein
MTDTEHAQAAHATVIAPEGTDPLRQDAPLAGQNDGTRAPEQATVAPEPVTKPRPAFDMEVLVGYILLIGVLTSITLIVGGLVWHFLRTGQMGIQYAISGMNFFEFLSSGLEQVLADQYRPRLLVSLGIAVLMLTPFLRVFASMVYFVVAARNWKYAIFTGFVLTVLTYSLFLR